ncbi:MAG: hypothetical protein K2W80_10340 [Burkholderiales bacterium]|nr:hypothetical protein [Burkholderiales bacterium]
MIDLFQPVIPVIAPTRRVTPLIDAHDADVLASRRESAAIARAAKSAKAATPEQRRELDRLARERWRRARGMKPRVILTPEQRKEAERSRHARKSSNPAYRERKAKAARAWRARQREQRTGVAACPEHSPR